MGSAFGRNIVPTLCKQEYFSFIIWAHKHNKHLRSHVLRYLVRLLRIRCSSETYQVYCDDGSIPLQGFSYSFCSLGIQTQHHDKLSVRLGQLNGSVVEIWHPRKDKYNTTNIKRGKPRCGRQQDMSNNHN